jgi:hypothetical protein
MRLLQDVLTISRKVPPDVHCKSRYALLPKSASFEWMNFIILIVNDYRKDWWLDPNALTAAL